MSCQAGAGIVVLAVNVAAAGPPMHQPDQVAHRLNQLEQRLDVLERDTSDDWLTRQRHQAMQQLVANVLRDADARQSLLDQAISAGYDGQYFIASPSGRTRVAVTGQIQSRFVFGRQAESPAGDDTRYGFDLRRLRLRFAGTLLDPRLHFVFGLSLGQRTSPGFQRSDVYASWNLNDRTAFHVGRFLFPSFQREELISSKRQLLTDRSLVHRSFTPGSVHGATIEHQGERTAVYAGILDLDEGIDDNRRTAMYGRVEIQLCGDRAQHNDLASFPGMEPAASVGGAVMWVNTDSPMSMDSDSHSWIWTVDAALEFGGASLFAAITGRDVDSTADAIGDQLGAVVQGGVFATDHLELIARYEWGESENGGDLHILSVGCNAYINGHGLKYTIDAGYAFDAVGPAWSNELRGWRTDAAGEHGQIVVRSQLQLLF